MDPDENLAEQRRISSRIIEATDNEREVREEDTARLAELVIALDEWIQGGGFLPKAWARR